MSTPTSHVFKIGGMDCAEEVAVLKREVGPLVGGEERLAFDILNGRMTVTKLPVGVDEQAVIQAVERAGLAARTLTYGVHQPEPEPSFWERQRRLLLT